MTMTIHYLTSIQKFMIYSWLGNLKIFQATVNIDF